MWTGGLCIFWSVSLTGLELAFYMLWFLEITVEIVAALHLAGFDILNSSSLFVGLQTMPILVQEKCQPFPKSPSPDAARWHPMALLSL